MTCLESLSVEDWAERLGALAISLEHRYFGQSAPYGLNYTEYAKWDPSVYEHLTLDNVLRDGVSFVNWIKNAVYPQTKNANAYVISGESTPVKCTALEISDDMPAGSYDGVLALLYRQQFDAYVDGVISLSPITAGFVSDPSDPLTYGWGDWVRCSDSYLVYRTPTNSLIGQHVYPRPLAKGSRHDRRGLLSDPSFTR